MGNIGRYVCVAMPFLLCVASLIALIVSGLAGVADKNLYIFQIRTANLSVSPVELKNLIGIPNLSDLSKVTNIPKVDLPKVTNIPKVPTKRAPVNFHEKSLLGTGSGTNTGAQAANAGTGAGNNVTASDLGLADVYDVSLWNYCYTTRAGVRECTRGAFNWASTSIDNNTAWLDGAFKGFGRNATISKTVNDSLVAFGSLIRWTQIVFIIACVLLGIELVFGLFANCSRAWSCVTWIIAGLATTATIAVAAMATVIGAVVVGAVEGTAKLYNVRGSINTRFLISIWIAAAFATAAGFFWIFTICCCKPERRPHVGRNKNNGEHGEKMMSTGAYQPLHEPEHNGFSNGNANNTAYGAARYPSGVSSDLAYEPYSHSRV